MARAGVKSLLSFLIPRAVTLHRLSPVCQGSLAEAALHGEASDPELELSRARQRGNLGNPDTSGMQKSNCVSGCKTEQVKAFHSLSVSPEQPKNPGT